MNLNDPQTRMEGFFPEYEHKPASSFQDVLDILASKATNMSHKGRAFEALVKAFIEMDKEQLQRFDKVWLWREYRQEYPKQGSMLDTGIDLVARERDGGGHIAIQCKFYASDTTIAMEHLNQFITTYSTTEFSGGVFVSTTAKWNRNAQNALRDREDKPIVRWGPEIFENSSIDWTDFSLTHPKALNRKPNKNLREYQRLALEDTLAGFDKHHRGKLIMACGSGKTFTALHIAERLAGAGGNALFLTPSISLLSQSLRDWTNDAAVPLKPFAVCSDASASNLRDDDNDDISPFDLPLPASTDAAKLKERFNAFKSDSAMSVVFSTYQSLDAVAEAQRLGLPKFDLIVCDEAHRTTGATLAGESESNFRRVHDDEFIAGEKRLYMTATPRIYGDAAKRRASDDGRVALASMDDESLFGPEFHRLGFGKAVEMDILSEYKVLIFDVDLEKTGADLDALLSASKSELNLDNGARMVGCWNGLRKRGATGVDFGRDSSPAKRAVAFSNSIAQSKSFAEYFPQVIQNCIAADAEDGSGESRLLCDVRHVDGTQNAMERSRSLAWLREEPDEGRARILTNARCLTEGVDVPALDAIMFMHPRRSEIDVVQAVGRVMRKSPGKRLGYIILPIARSPGSSPQDTVNESAYRAVWQVINAISAHDDRFEAKINQLKLALDTPPEYPEQEDIGDDGSDRNSGGFETEQIELPLAISGSPEFRDAILATVVDKYSNPRFWEQWANRVRDIAERHEARIRALLASPGSDVRAEFDRFLTGLRSNLNDGVSEDEAIGMLSQHLVSKPVFDALFDDYAFADLNPVSRAMQSVIDALQDRGLEKETEGLERFYRDVRIRAEGVSTAAGKQRIIVELYERFLTKALPETAKNLGIVYTPVQIVDYIIRSVEDVLNEKFGASLGDEGVHVIDPFTGTGTFITRLIQSGFIGRGDLRRKYREEIHANEIMLLAYYIAAVNIEAAYHDAAGEDNYTPFPNIVLTDTFQSYEPGAPMDDALFPSNNERVERQKKLDIRVVIGNPPWSANNNRKYPGVDERVEKSYADASTQKQLQSLYDPYVKAIRLASDRVIGNEEGGIVAFVTNGGFIDSNAFDGFRKTVSEEFDNIYCYNLRGNQRTSGDLSRREGGKVFGSGSRAGVGILILVKAPAGAASRRSQQAQPAGAASRRSQQAQPAGAANISYRDIGNLLSREQKLDILREGSLNTTDWQPIIPNLAGDWINQRSNTFPSFRLLAFDARSATSPDAPVFNLKMPGVSTGKDAVIYNSSNKTLINNIRELAHRTSATITEADFRISLYRPFFKQRLCYNRKLITRPSRFYEVFPEPSTDNQGICISLPGTNRPFHALIVDSIADVHLTGDSSYFPRWTYQEANPMMRKPGTESLLLRRVSNINPKALSEFRAHYSDDSISDDDLFDYVYGVLHSAQYREAFANDLSKSQARIPMAASIADFRSFVQAGMELANLHVNYETEDPYPLEEIYADGWKPNAPDAYKVIKMKYPGKRPNLDKTRIAYSAGITLAGIPPKAQGYVLGTRSALDWLMERYQVKPHSASGITNDPNDWASEVGEPRYIVDLIKRVTTVSVRTVDIVNGLPELPMR